MPLTDKLDEIIQRLPAGWSAAIIGLQVHDQSRHAALGEALAICGVAPVPPGQAFRLRLGELGVDLPTAVNVLRGAERGGMGGLLTLADVRASAGVLARWTSGRELLPGLSTDPADWGSTDADAHVWAVADLARGWARSRPFAGRATPGSRPARAKPTASEARKRSKSGQAKPPSRR